MSGRTDHTLEVRSRLEWRAWLRKHHSVRSEVWLVFNKRHTGLPSISYNAAVEEALCSAAVSLTYPRGGLMTPSLTTRQDLFAGHRHGSKHPDLYWTLALNMSAATFHSPSILTHVSRYFIGTWVPSGVVPSAVPYTYAMSPLAATLAITGSHVACGNTSGIPSQAARMASRPSSRSPPGASRTASFAWDRGNPRYVPVGVASGPFHADERH